ncbi:MAG TPA: DUF1269 domain-containing protein [Solirubrobacteraceae bacterium]|nr:DUF1269 domain-containing protein [Solirubrobacteraceae bacterium]
MTSSELTFAVVAAYDELDRARADFAAVEDLAAAHELHLDDAALLRHAVGHVEVERHDARSTTRGAEGGIIVGALVGLLFPPALAGLAVGAAAGGGLGATIGHLWHGFSRQDLTDLGSLVEEGEAAIVAIGSEAFAGEVEQALGGATRIVRQSVDVDRDLLRAAAVGRT